jgi:hypothetical protein
MIHSIFGQAGLYLEKLIRKLNWVYLFQGFPGIFPVLTWETKHLDTMDAYNATFEDVPKDMCIPWGKALIDFLCGKTSDDFEQSIFNGVCTQRLSQIAMRYFFVAKVINSSGKEHLKVNLHLLIHLF